MHLEGYSSWQLWLYLLSGRGTGHLPGQLLGNSFPGSFDRLMGVRPRTKEFLLGHPFMLAVLYYGFDLRKSAVLLFGLIGQISLINTYAHIHTPLLISPGPEPFMGSGWVF